MLFDSELEPLTAANRYLLDKIPPAKRRTGDWENTQRSYADDLAQWWTFLCCVGLAWDEVTYRDLEEYAASLANHISAQTARQLAPSTRRRRLGTVCDFYDWAFAEGLVPEAVIKGPAPRDRLLWASQNDASQGKSRKLRLLPDEDDAGRRISPLNPSDLQKVFRALGPPAFPATEGLGPGRNRLAAEIALHSGMRVSEITAVTIYQILSLEPKIDSADPWKQLMLRITRTKSGKARNVYLPSFLVVAIIRYIGTERSAIIAAARMRGKFSAEHARLPLALFLNGTGSTNKNLAMPVKASTISRAFTKAVKGCGLIRTEVGFQIDPATGQAIIDGETGAWSHIAIEVAAHTFHDLRHTFAVNLYEAECAAGNASPWKKVQARLGHEWLTTTTEIYLAWVEDKEPAISDAFAKYLDEERHIHAS
ncbi:tyrosine-type recombinase/integrase [Oricola nitratireducens]|uniref:tyrosine-type recombinase/integrase n=1 Tax=Oricola nitratireducens TaxID=2775868 RepID=UPI001866FBF3|nr:tyrosine-type recombinase/integrase [Oricola nitratireducens]